MAAKPPKKDKRPPPEAGDDAWLWQAVTDDVTPLKRRKKAPARPAPKPEPAAPAKTKDAKRKPAGPAPAKATPMPKREEISAIAPGPSAGLDKRTAQKLRRGILPIEAELDLHGMTQAEARPRLDGFLARAQARGLRCVRVITGIGRAREEGGVLRAAVPRWLNEPPNRARVLAFNLAQPKDGGHGALYVLLRKLREN